MRTLASIAAASLVAGLAIACSSDPPKVVSATGMSHPPVKSTDPPGVAPLLPSEVVANLDDDTATTLFSRRADGGLVIYTSKGRWWSRAVDKDGKPKGAAVDAGPAGELVPGLGALRPTTDGYVAVWAELVAQNRAIKILALDPAGAPKGAPVLVTQIGDSVRWVDVLPNEKGALLAWEVPRGDRMEVSVVAVVGGKLQGNPVHAVKDAIGWEAVATPRGAAIAAVFSNAAAPPPPPKDPKAGPKRVNVTVSAESEATGSGKTGHVAIIEVDASGKVAPPVVVSAGTSAQSDVQLAEVGGRYVLAWTDERDLDGAVYVAAVDPGGKVAVAPRRATSPFGEQALVALVGQGFEPGAPPEGKRAMLAWEEVTKAGANDLRLVHLATLGADGALGAERATLAMAVAGPPDIAPDGDGWTVTTLAPSPDAAQPRQGPRANGAPKGREDTSDVVPVWPAFARFGADLSLRGAEPVRAAAFPPEYVPELTHWLSCRAGGCLTLATGGGAGAPLALVSLPARKSGWRPAAQRDADDNPPRALAAVALVSGDHIAKVAAAELTGGAKLSAWITYFAGAARTAVVARKKGAPPPPAPRDDGPAARLEIRPLAVGDASLAHAGKPVLISQKALSIGGVSLSAAPAVGNKPPETVLAWVAKERGEPQVFVTKLGPDGKKLAQKGVTVISRKKNGKDGFPSECSDVSVAFDGADGWTVAWVDTRDGDAEVYVAKVDRSMTKVVPDKRITQAVGDASEVQLFVHGKETLVAWSDARANPAGGGVGGDIFLARLETATLKKLGPETRVFASKENSRSPQFVNTPNGLMLAWIEAAGESRTGVVSDPDAGLRVAHLDERGAVIGAPTLIHGPRGGAVTSAVFSCDKSCRGVLTSPTSEGLALAAFDLLAGGRAGPLKVISALTGSATSDPSLAFASPSSLFFSDDSVGGQGRVRWMQLAW